MEDCSVVCPSFDNIDWEAPSVKPNPDISGIGVVIGFITSAYMTVAFVVIYDVMDCVSKTYNTNAVDKAFLRVLRKIPGLQPSKSWEPAIRNAVLIVSDQQLVTGISLLTSGYAQLTCNLSSYHWQILVYLSWFSSLTHLTTLTILREYLQENTGIRTWRVLLMLLTFVMLVIALLPTGHSKWLFWPPLDPSPYTDGVPVLCFFKMLGIGGRENRFTSDPDQTSSMVISIVVLCFGYMTRLIKISAWATNSTNQWFRERPGNLLKRVLAETESRSLLPGASLYWKLKCIVLGTMHFALRASLDLYSSLLWEIIWLVFAMVWGSIHLFHAEEGITKRNGELEQSIWSFGQCVSVILLVQPLLSIAETCYETRRKAKQSMTTKTASTCSENPVAGVDDRYGHDQQEGPYARPFELRSSTRRVQSSDVQWHSGQLQGSNDRSTALLSTPFEGQSSVVQGLEIPYNTSRSESFWILVTLILVMTSELVIYMLYNTSRGVDFYLTWVMVVFGAPLHPRFVHQLRTVLRGVAAMFAQVAPFESDVADARTEMWARVGLHLLCIGRRDGNIHPVQQLRLFCGFMVFKVRVTYYAPTYLTLACSTCSAQFMLITHLFKSLDPSLSRRRYRKPAIVRIVDSLPDRIAGTRAQPH